MTAGVLKALHPSRFLPTTGNDAKGALAVEEDDILVN